MHKIHVTAVGWNPDASQYDTRHMLLGTRDQKIYQLRIKFEDKEIKIESFKEMCTLASKYPDSPIIGLSIFFSPDEKSNNHKSVILAATKEKYDLLK